jgi:DNA-binding NarL/FixJ family response regulator
MGERLPGEQLDPAERKQIRKLYRVEERRALPAPDHGADVIELAPLLGEREQGRLSDRETEVLQLAADGFTNREIGHILFVSEQTVKSHIRAVLAKLPARNRAHAVAVACRRGLVS